MGPVNGIQAVILTAVLCPFLMFLREDAVIQWIAFCKQEIFYNTCDLPRPIPHNIRGKARVLKIWLSNSSSLNQLAMKDAFLQKLSVSWPLFEATHWRKLLADLVLIIRNRSASKMPCAVIFGSKAARIQAIWEKRRSPCAVTFKAERDLSLILRLTRYKLQILPKRREQLYMRRDCFNRHLTD